LHWKVRRQASHPIAAVRRQAHDQLLRVEGTDRVTDSIDDRIIDTPDGPMTWGEWKKKNRVQVPSRRTKGNDLPNKIKTRTDRE